MTMLLLLLVSISLIMVGCGTAIPEKPVPSRYEVHKLTEAMSIDGKWDKPQWRSIQPIEIKRYMGEKPEYQPATQAKVLYDDNCVYVIFCIQDQYVRAVAKEYHGPVWRDSCVEFFFTPGNDLSLGYFNLEINCGGTALFHYQKAPGQDSRKIDVADMSEIEIFHSLPKIVDPEITTPVTWTIEYRLPLAIVEKYCQIIKPGPGVTWRANFYKCAETNSHPHWLTWSFVDNPEPSFHRPEFFGVLEFAQ